MIDFKNLLYGIPVSFHDFCKLMFVALETWFHLFFQISSVQNSLRWEFR